MKKEITNFEDLENLLKKYNVSYPKVWKSKFIKKTRKERDESKWKDCRICLYAAERVNNCSESIINPLLEYNDHLLKKVKDFILNILITFLTAPPVSNKIGSCIKIIFSLIYFFLMKFFINSFL